MTKILIILSIIIAILLGLLGVTYKSMRNQRQDAIRWENNYEESQKDISRIQMDLFEFKEQASHKEDSLLNALKIKPKQVEKIIYVDNQYTNTDTIPIDLLDVTISDLEKEYNPISNAFTTISEMTFIERIDCVTIQGVLKTTDVNPKLNITSISYSNNITYVAYWKRREWKLVGIKTRLFGKKQGKLKVSSTCGSITVKEIDIIKDK